MPEGNSLGPGKGSGCRERKSSRRGWPRVGSQSGPQRGRVVPGAWLGLGVGVHSLQLQAGSTGDFEEAACWDL